MFHNDAPIVACIDLLPDTGFDVLNWGKQTDVTWAAQRLGGRMCLMGNVSPLELGVQGTPEQVYAASLEVLQQAGDHPLILSLGGAVTIGMPPANVRAMVQAAADFNRTKTAG